MTTSDECEHIATQTLPAVLETDDGTNRGQVRVLITTCVTCHETTAIEEDRW